MSERVLLGGTDGFRGLAMDQPGPGLINEETFAGATYALVAHQLDLGESGAVVVSQDTRPSGSRLRQAVIAGAVMHGIEVWDLGIAPTPMAQKVARELGGLATVVVTASHNPYSDNGWKGMARSDKPSKGMVRAISDRYWGQVESGLTIPRDNLRGVIDKTELSHWYTNQVVADIEREFGKLPLDGKLFVVDGAYGAAQKLTPVILTRLGAVVETFCCDGTGRINDNCGAADLDGLKDFLTKRPDLTSNPNFVGAIANDGDADRMMGIGHIKAANGDIQLVEINGNHVMGALAEGEPGIVGTEYTNTGLVRKLREQGIGFEYCSNGDVYVTEKLREKQAAGQPWRRGGEFTGHHVIMDWLSSGDGIRMAAWFAAFVVKHGITFGQVYQDLPLWAEQMRKVSFPGNSRDAIKQDPAVKEMLSRTVEELGDDGRIILRPSGTEPAVRVWGESTSLSLISHHVTTLAALVQLRSDELVV